MKKYKVLCSIVFVFCLLTFAVAVLPEALAAYPDKPVRMIVPFPAGGNTDIIARAISNKLSENLGQPIVIENRGGAGSVIGTEIAVKSPPDGYTILMVSGAYVMNPAMMKKLPFDPIKDLAGISMVADVPAALVVHPSLPVKTLQELIALAKAKPGELNFASSGNGSIGHLSGELLKSMAKINIQHVPYKGNAPAMTDLLGGHVQMLLTSIPAVMPHVKSGKIRLIAVAGPKRSLAAPDIPTMIESGIPGYIVSAGFGLLAPVATPKEIIKRLHTGVVKVLEVPEVRNLLASQGAEPVGNTPEEYDTFLHSEIKKWQKVVKEAGIQPE